MSTRREIEAGVRAIDAHGVLLVYPVDNAPEPRSLWSVLHPRTAMRWSWDEGADPRVAAMWRLREALARSRRVVYAKWYRGRATFFSRPVFRALLEEVNARAPERTLSRTARDLLEILEDDSPRSTKALRRSAALEGKARESTYTRALAELWSRLAIVGFGEIDDGAFPSLAVGATRVLFEDLWDEARDPNRATRDEDRAALRRALDASPKLARAFTRSMRLLERPPDLEADVV